MSPASDMPSAGVIFGEALEQPLDRRGAFLDRACAGAPALRAEVEALLAAHSRAVGFMTEPTASLATDGPADPGAFSEGPGTRIGPYKLLQLIGEGGFGSVFLAEQQEPVIRKVALKIIKVGMDTRQVIARFEAERQALAMMDHPNIARVLDAGATETGRPYFVMELVRGEPITEYCDKHTLSITSRLELFTQVCNAVQHAHQKGIIHRDIKPSNVLVTVHDAKPVPKVIDFGIAKATISRLTAKTLFTEHRALIGTPEYMSPEQADIGATDIDTRSDIYSLGVLLYELLTGVTPHDAKSLRSAAFAEMQRIIREVDPPKPSTRLSTLDTLASVAAQRTIEPKRLGALVRGDLDWIVMKCLEKERSRRYETANGLAADVQRHLVGDAVVAAPPTRRYRLGKFVRRNRGPVAATAIICMVLLGGIVGTTAGFVTANRRAVSEAQAKAEALTVAAFQSRMLGSIEMNAVGIGLVRDMRERAQAGLTRRGLQANDLADRMAAFDTSLAGVNATDVAIALIDRTILRPAVLEIDKEFKNQPVVDAGLRQTVADVYQKLSLYGAALPLQESALATRRSALGNDDRETLYSVAQMGSLLCAIGKALEAKPYYDEALAGRRRRLGERHADTLASISNMGFLMLELGKLDDAQRFMRDAYERRRDILGEDHADTLISQNNLAHLIRRRGDYAQARALYEQVLERRRRILGPDDPDTLSSIDDVGCVLLDLGEEQEAVKHLREALEGRRRVLGESNQDTLSSMNNLAAVLEDVGPLSEAEELYRTALAQRRATVGEMHPFTLESMSNLAHLLQTIGQSDRAEELYLEALRRYRVVRSDDHPETLVAINNVGWILQKQNKLKEAEPYYREALDRARKNLGPDSPDTLRQIDNMGNLLRKLGNLNDAEVLLREAEEKYRRRGSPDRDALVCLQGVGLLRQAQGNLEDAEKYFREAMEGARATLGEEQLDTFKFTYSLGQVLIARGRPGDAEKYLHQAMKGFRRLLGDEHALTVAIVVNLAGAMAEQQEFANAESLLLEITSGVETRQPSAPQAQKLAKALQELYTTWDKAEPGKGYDGKAAECGARLESSARAPGAAVDKAKK